MVTNLLPRVLWLFGERLVARRDSGVLEFCYRRISAVKQCKPLRSSQSKNSFFFRIPSRVSPGAHPLTKKPEDSGYEVADPNRKPLDSDNLLTVTPTKSIYFSVKELEHCIITSRNRAYIVKLPSHMTT